MTEPGAVEVPVSARVAMTLDDDDGTRRHDPTTRELRDAHQAAWEAYLLRLCIRAAGGNPGPGSPPLGRGQQRDRLVPAPVRDLCGDGWRGMLAPMTTGHERLAWIKTIAKAVHTRRQPAAGDR